MDRNKLREGGWRFTVSKTEAKSYLEQAPKFVRVLAEQCAKAFVKARNTEPRKLK